MSKYLRLSLLAAKNIFCRGSIYYRVYRAILILGLPYLVADFDQDLEEIRAAAGDINTAEGAMKLLKALYQPVPLMDQMLAYLIPLLILLMVYWLWEMFVCVRFKNNEKIKMNDEEITYVKFSLILFVYFIFIVDYNYKILIRQFIRWEYHNIIGLVSYAFYGFSSFGFIILGIYLTIKARNKIPVFLDLMLTTFCLAITFKYVYLEIFSGH